MSKQIAFMLTGLSLAVSSMGCCCLSGYANRCNPCGGCPSTGGGYYPPQSTMMQTMDGGQAAYSSGLTQTAAMNGAIMGAPIMASPGGYTTTVMVPANSLTPY